MPRIEQFLVLICLVGTTLSAHAYECFRADVDPTSIAHSKQAGTLYFLAPSQSGEVGQMIVESGAQRARSAVHWRNAQPIRYKFDAVPGTFTRGVSSNGRSSFVVRDGTLALNVLNDRLVILVEPKPGSREYALEPLGNRECAKIFPPAPRDRDDVY